MQGFEIIGRFFFIVRYVTWYPPKAFSGTEAVYTRFVNIGALSLVSITSTSTVVLLDIER